MSRVDIVLFDMAQLTISRHHAGTGAHDVARIDLPNVGTLFEVSLPANVSRREGVFITLDAALAGLELPSANGDWCRVAFYNPLTRQAAFGPVPVTEVYTDGTPLDVPVYGMSASLEEGLLRVGDRRLSRLSATTDSTRAALAAHA